MTSANAAGDSNRAFFVSVIQATVALTASALAIVALFYLTTQESRHAAQQSDAEEIFFAANSFRQVIGSGSRSQSQVEVTGLDDGRALLVRNASLASENFNDLSFTASNFHPGVTVYFIWRTIESGGKIFNARLYPSGADGGRLQDGPGEGERE